MNSSANICPTCWRLARSRGAAREAPFLHLRLERQRRDSHRLARFGWRQDTSRVKHQSHPLGAIWIVKVFCSTLGAGIILDQVLFGTFSLFSKLLSEMPPLYINHLEATEIQLTSSISSHQIPPQLCPEPPWPSCENPAFLVPEIRDPRSTVLLKSTLEVWWLRSGGRSKRLGFPWWNCWMKQSPKWWMNQSPNTIW